MWVMERDPARGAPDGDGRGGADLRAAQGSKGGS